MGAVDAVDVKGSLSRDVFEISQIQTSEAKARPLEVSFAVIRR